jgi:hypothetical protein
MLAAQFSIGVIFGLMYRYINTRNNIGYFVIFYAMLFMAIIYQSIDEQLLTSFLSVDQVFTVLFTGLLYALFLKKRLNITQ